MDLCNQKNGRDGFEQNILMRGSYVLLMELNEDADIKIGALGTIHFRKGCYAYVGSAMNGIEKRVERHMKKEKKKRWHIDYFLEKAKIVKVFYKESIEKEECKLAGLFIKNAAYVKNFGASDCRCHSHLFYSECSILERIAIEAGMKVL